MKYIGIDGCKDGWFCVTLDETDMWSYCVINNSKSLSELTKNANSVLIDIPIGLLDNITGGRQCDIEGRRLLRPKRSSSVFPSPARKTLSAKSYTEAQLINRNSIGCGLSQQSWGIVPKIREIDDLLTKSNHLSMIRECHPEICFWALNSNNAMQYNKKKKEGRLERLSVLHKYFKHCHELFENAKSQYLRRQVAYDDIIDAMVCAVTAKYGYNQYSTIPIAPNKDAKGLPMEMVYWLP